MQTATTPTSPADPLACARQPEDLMTIAFAGVIGVALRSGRQPLIRGLSEARFQKLQNEFFVGLALHNGTAPPASPADIDEFDELVELLLEFRALPTEQAAWLAYAVASAAMGENHFWQVMGLPSRKHLSELITGHFPALAARYVGDMKWKKFFYRQLCESAGVPICKSPH